MFSHTGWAKSDQPGRQGKYLQKHKDSDNVPPDRVHLLQEWRVKARMYLILMQILTLDFHDICGMLYENRMKQSCFLEKHQIGLCEVPESNVIVRFSSQYRNDLEFLYIPSDTSNQSLFYKIETENRDECDTAFGVLRKETVGSAHCVYISVFWERGSNTGEFDILWCFFGHINLKAHSSL